MKTELLRKQRSTRNKTSQISILGERMRLILLLLVTLSCSLRAESAPNFGRSVTFAKNEEPASLDNLRGKIVIVLFYQSWCPICNKWAPNLVKQMQTQYGDQSHYVLIGMKTDGGSPEDAKSFLTEKGADGASWIFASDNEQAYYASVINDTPLWGYAVISPDGEITDKGKAGTFYTGGQTQEFVLPGRKKDFDKQFSTAKKSFLPEGKTYAAELKNAVKLAETGRFVSALVSARSAGGIPGKEFEGDIMTLLGERVTRYEQQARDTNNSARYSAFMSLRDMSAQMKTLAPGKAAQKIVSELNKDKSIQREQKAEQAWLSLMAAVGKQPPEKRQAALAANVPAYVKAYDGTYFAQLAQKSVPQ
jgi:peroxiredoxin